ncbi:MAG TPA: hypothetical protein VMT64_16160, partial [Candidatus Binataceae bacterium]|nr:hypothetical protein [Candidatus Binataceae bacterium]
ALQIGRLMRADLAARTAPKLPGIFQKTHDFPTFNGFVSHFSSAPMSPKKNDGAAHATPHPGC